jgi:hypothetical protein
VGHSSDRQLSTAYGHLLDDSLWDAVQKVTDHTEASRGPRTALVEPPVRIESTTFSCRGH